MSHLLLTVFVYGPNERRLEIEVRPKIPDDLRGNANGLQAWAESIIFQIGGDFKHTQNWGCEMCGKPARETNFNMASWVHLAEPRMVVYIHQICKASGNTCHRKLEMQQVATNSMVGLPPTPPMRLPKPAGSKFPLSSSCRGCMRDETGKKGHKMSRCGGCKLVSHTCQKNDWGRHKKFCKMVESVNWVGWD
ncbi:hypothetical protein Hypma_008238 [Hypsizygus marmoreus]|uniref:MYND-type domain-containing protein n=1 Tax=Hypsizygus marmoreus TaxID=39966 RepID=A0A369K149_HYPMA|nr:hypothetical protein Hypma_008238 [Hypsizygus marmoreus]